MSAFRFDARRESFVKAQNRFADFFIRQIVPDSMHAQPLSDPLDSAVFSERELKFMFAICRRPSVCLSSVCLSVTFVRPTQSIEIFGTVSSPFGTLAIC